MKKKRILFDMDGTLINSKKGITLSAQYALEAFGIKEPDPDRMEYFIGPPLEYTFMTHYGFTKEQAAQAVEKYRERYEVTGIHECELYPDVKETIESLKRKGYQIGVGSSKPEESCEIILKHHGIYELFDDVCGAEKNGPRNDKKDVLLECIRRSGLSAKDLVLIGDTKYDVEGAREVGMDCVAVSFGFGNVDEMIEMGAVKICNSMKEVDEFFE